MISLDLFNLKIRNKNIQEKSLKSEWYSITNSLKSTEKNPPSISAILYLEFFANIRGAIIRSDA